MANKKWAMQISTVSRQVPSTLGGRAVVAQFELLREGSRALSGTKKYK